MRLDHPEIIWQALHRMGADGDHLGVTIGFTYPDWWTPGLRFEYSIDDGRSWRPLNRNNADPRRSWSGIAYGVKSGETIGVRATLDDDVGPVTWFVVIDGIDAGVDHLRTFIPKTGERGFKPSVWHRKPRRQAGPGRPVHFTVGSSHAYRLSPDCSALRSGQSGVAWRGGSPAEVLSGTVTDAIFEGKRPCRVCHPPAG
jgi:hypothetical protein